MGFDGRQALVEDNLKWRATFDGKQLTIEDLRFHSAFTISVSFGIDIQYQYESYPGICIIVVNWTNFHFPVSENAKKKGEIIGKL